MAELAGNLWEFNFAKVIIIDVSDDYRLMQPPLPSECYPVVKEVLLPRHNLSARLPQEGLVPGFLYDWHQTPPNDAGEWYVGVVDEQLANALIAGL